MSVPHETLKQIAADLQGTCKSLDEACRNYDLTEDDLTPEEIQTIEEDTMLCDSCGWWVEQEEINENGDCEDCAEDHEV